MSTEKSTDCSGTSPLQETQKQREPKYRKITVRISLSVKPKFDFLCQKHGGITKAIEDAIDLAYNQLYDQSLVHQNETETYPSKNN